PGRLCTRQWSPGDRPGSQGSLGFRVRIPDGADEPAPRPGHRDRLHDAGRGLHLCQQPPREGSREARRRRQRPRAARGRGPAARPLRTAEVRMMSVRPALARRLDAISVSPTLQVMMEAKALRARGVDVIDFGPGEPDFDSPENVKRAGKAAIDANLSHYTD